MNLEQIVQQLCQAPGLSGREDDARAVAMKILEELELGNCSVTPLGSLICRSNMGGEHPVMLEAHLDQVGMVVTRVEDGFLHVANCGGIDRRLLPAQRVTVHTASGPRACVVASTPPHLKGDDEGPAKWEDILIDTGYSAEEAREIFAPGDTITPQAGFVRLQGSRISSPALDDRAGCAAVLWAAKLLKEAGYNRPLVLALCSFEELGGQGAATAAFAEAPRCCYAVDVSFAAASGIPEAKCGKLAQGPMVGVAPILNREMTQAMLALAKENGIHTQLEVMGGSTGTDADKIVSAVGGIPTALLSIPQRNLHTPVEGVDLQVIETTARLMALAVMGGDR